jgi:hypothetical protein
MLEPVRPEAVLPDRALHLPTFSHFLIVNTTSLLFSRGGETCPEAGSKRALPSDKSAALSPEHGFPLNNVRVRGHTDPYT